MHRKKFFFFLLNIRERNFGLEFGWLSAFWKVICSLFGSLAPVGWGFSGCPGGISQLNAP